MTALPLERIARSFHRHRASYGDHATPQSLFARDLARRLDRASGARHFESVFEFGCGSGHLTRALAARFVIGQLALNDLVAQPLPQDLPCPLRFRTGPVEDAELPARIDLLASASTIQWLADPAATLARLCARVARGGWLAVSGFGPAQFRELSAQNGAGAPSLMAPEAMARLLPEGWQVADCGQRVLRQWFAEPRDLLHHLRRTGVNGLARRGWTRRDLAGFCTDLRAAHGDGTGRVPLSWHPVWLVAHKRG